MESQRAADPPAVQSSQMSTREDQGPQSDQHRRLENRLLNPLHHLNFLIQVQMGNILSDKEISKNLQCRPLCTSSPGVSSTDTLACSTRQAGVPHGASHDGQKPQHTAPLAGESGCHPVSSVYCEADSNRPTGAETGSSATGWRAHEVRSGQGIGGADTSAVLHI